jgi:uncharacterized protein Smg (DUF494 family)
MAREVHNGTPLKKVTISDDLSKKYNDSEVSAAYSYLYEHFAEKQKNKGQGYSHGTIRVLHFAERMIITKEAYGYLLDLNNLGLLSIGDMEQVIESIMLHASSRIGLTEIKQRVSDYMMKSDHDFLGWASKLNGDETIN